MQALFMAKQAIKCVALDVQQHLRSQRRNVPFAVKKIKLVVNDLVGVAKWLDYHKLTLNLDKTKCMLIGSNRKRQSKVDLTVSILDHSMSTVCYK